MWDPLARSFFTYRHQTEVRKEGQAFEDYVVRALRAKDEDLLVPDAYGSLGDFGGDAVSVDGTIVYACYGQEWRTQNAGSVTVAKVRSDFARALDKRPHMREWRFVTNAKTGPQVEEAVRELALEHQAGSARPIQLRVWKTAGPQDDLWDKVVAHLSVESMDVLLPGRPGTVRTDLHDVVPLLRDLERAAPVDPEAVTVTVPPPDKESRNLFPPGARLEMNEGRMLAPEIARWYQSAGDVEMYDRHATKFRTMYDDAARLNPEDPSAILDMLYQWLGGPSVRQDARVRSCAYAVVAYFFDGCHIFPEAGIGEARTGGGDDAAPHAGRVD